MKNSIKAILMVLVTVIVVPIPYWVDEFLLDQHVIMWQHFPGMVAGIVWSILSFTIATILEKSSSVPIPSFKRPDRAEKPVKQDKSFTLDQLKDFAANILLKRLQIRYLSKLEEAKDKKGYCRSLVEEVCSADPKYKS